MNIEIKLILSVILTTICIFALKHLISNYLNTKIAFALNQNRVNLIQNNTKLDFENDIQFLSYLINFKVKTTMDMIFKTLSESNKSVILNDKITNTNIEKISSEVLDLLSDDYKIILSKYFKKEKLDEYIIENIFVAVTHAVVAINTKKISNITFGKNNNENKIKERQS